MYPLVLQLFFHPDISALASDDYAVREAAEARLCRWADLSWPYLDRPFADCEQRRRARRVVAHAVPCNTPPIALLTGRPLAEWEQDWTGSRAIGPCPGPDWRLAWLRPDTHGPLAWVVQHYGERARTQYLWRDWHSDADGREATRLLVRDLLAVGVPAPLVRELIASMERSEEQQTTAWKARCRQ